MPMQHAKVFFFIIVVVTKEFIVAFLLPRCLVGLIVRFWFIQWGLHALAEILNVLQGSCRGFEILNLHLQWPLDWGSEL